MRPARSSEESKGAAARLGLKRTTLLSKMQKLGISRFTKYTSVMQKEGAKGATADKRFLGRSGLLGFVRQRNRLNRNQVHI